MMAGKIEPMSERAQALEAAIRKIRAHTSYNPAAGRAFLAELLASVERIADAALAAPPVGVSPQPDTRRDCTCLGTCRGAEGLGPRWKCALEKSASLSPVEPTPEPPPDAQVCVWRATSVLPNPTFRSECVGGDVSVWLSAADLARRKVCPYCGKRLEAGTAPQGGEQ